MNIRDVSVVLLGHGSRYDENAESCIVGHAQALNSHGMFRGVYVGFIRQKPDVVDVINMASSKVVFVVPMLMSGGLIMEKVGRVLNEKFGEVSAIDVKNGKIPTGKVVFVCKPIGTHEMMSEIIKKKASEILKENRDEDAVLQKDVSLFIAAHGNSKDGRARAVVEQHVKTITREKVFRDVHGVYIEEEPVIGRVYELAESERIVVVPFFADRGPHVMEDIPMMLGEDRKEIVRRLESRERVFKNPTLRKGKYIWLSEPVGCESKALDIVVRCVVEKFCESDASFLF